MAQPDWTDALLNRLAATRSAREIEPFEVTARISRLSLHIARIQEESFGRFGLNRGEVGVLAALMLAGPKQRLSPTQLFKGLMLSSAGITSRLDRLESRGYLKRTRHATDPNGCEVVFDAGSHLHLAEGTRSRLLDHVDVMIACTDPYEGTGRVLWAVQPGYLSGSGPARAGSRRTRPFHARESAAHPGSAG